MSSATSERTHVREKVKLPKAGLLALFTAGFLGIINETIPAGLLYPPWRLGVRHTEASPKDGIQSVGDNAESAIGERR
jgi:hypothetical protein